MGYKSLTEQLITQQRLIAEWKDGLPIFNKKSQMFPNDEFGLLVGEYQEARDEFERSFSAAEKYRPVDEGMEIVDILVFLSAIQDANGAAIDYSNVGHHPVALNGAGSYDDFYEVLGDVAENLGSGNLARNAEQLLSLSTSRIRHLPGDQDIVELTQQVIEKNKDNHPAKYHSIFNERGEKLSDEEVMAKQKHVRMMLRVLRTKFGSPLESWMHEPFSDLILNFKNSEKSLAELKGHLAVLDSILLKIVLYGWQPIDFRREYFSHELGLLQVALQHGLLNDAGKVSSRTEEYVLMEVANGQLLSPFQN